MHFVAEPHRLLHLQVDLRLRRVDQDDRLRRRCVGAARVDRVRAVAGHRGGRVDERAAVDADEDVGGRRARGGDVTPPVYQPFAFAGRSGVIEIVPVGCGTGIASK